MRHSERVEALFPGFKGSEVAYTKRHMVKPDPALVKGPGIALVMRHGRDTQTAWVDHRPSAITRLLPFGEELEAHHLLA